MPITARTFDTPLGQWTHHLWVPGPADPLAGVIEQVVHSDGVALHPRERVFPTGVVELTIQLGAPYALAVPDAAPQRCATVCLTGVQLRPMLLEAPADRVAHVGARLTPPTAHLLLGVPLSALCAPSVDLGPVLGRAAEQLAEACGEAPTPERRIAAAVAWARRRLAAAGDPSGVLAGPIAWAWSRIAERGGAASIAGLRERTGLSKARFVEDFRRIVGVGPKQYARVARFGRALALLERHPGRALPAIALDAGYYDQSHMTTEFRALGELTPAEVRARERYWDSPAVTEPGG